MTAFFWHCSGRIELAFPTVGPAVSAGSAGRAQLECTHTHAGLQATALATPPKLSPHTHA